MKLVLYFLTEGTRHVLDTRSDFVLRAQRRGEGAGDGDGVAMFAFSIGTLKDFFQCKICECICEPGIPFRCGLYFSANLVLDYWLKEKRPLITILSSFLVSLS